MQRNSTIGELMERKRIQDGAKEYQGHTYMDLARFDDATKHMIIFDVLTDESPVGWKGERNRLYLSDVGYQKALDNQKAGNIKIISHAAVAKGNLYYDHRDMAVFAAPGKSEDEKGTRSCRSWKAIRETAFGTESGCYEC